MAATALPETGKAVRAMYIGLALTVLAALAPLIDVATVDGLGAHVRSAYPNWPDDLVATDRNAIAGYLAVIGALGIAGWLWSIVGARKHARWVRVVSTIMFSLGASVALLNLSLSGGAYTNVIPPLHSALGALPALAGLAAVVLLWKR
ncbi:hypothetical protein SAMN02982929_03591 [Saccharopolyspora kobensis]|uniref:DUF4383 domain-containing protein n=1 Tax=Saccharopolyspora kobensis TaxID=146035 RepID=A0A1H6CVW8_9PSEU|nr:hypothetical protein [Saccharopolyspora kobensis]SEG76988.1 hypothetical protein SAMN02982929_03591 [Saccharopolyspora kobensis]SFD00930.1 hypothetical protein SAMN05216506_102185 [Saccharopolyspora kobensis]